jgi:hypothetical protein
VLTFLVIRIAFGIVNLTDLLSASVHRLTNSFITEALSEHLDNPVRRKRTFSIAQPLGKGQLPLPKGQAAVHAQVWIFLCLNIISNLRFSRLWNQKLGSSPLPDPRMAVEPKI